MTPEVREGASHSFPHSVRTASSLDSFRHGCVTTEVELIKRRAVADSQIFWTEWIPLVAPNRCAECGAADNVPINGMQNSCSCFSPLCLHSRALKCIRLNMAVVALTPSTTAVVVLQVATLPFIAVFESFA